MTEVIAVIPAYNEAATLADIVRRTRAQLKTVIVVDDGSTDSTTAQLNGLDVTVLQHAENRGKAASLWTGIQSALEHGAQLIVTLDADGQHRPEDISRLLTAAHSGSSQRIVVAAREGKRETAPKVRQFANFMADFWISWAAGYPVRDSQSGFRVYPAALFARLDDGAKLGRRFVFESEVLIDAAYAGFYALPVTIDSVYPVAARRSYYRPWQDTLLITRMVAWKLIVRGLYPLGLLRALGLLKVKSI